MHAAIRKRLKENVNNKVAKEKRVPHVGGMSDMVAEETSVLYGGSVNDKKLQGPDQVNQG